jgi:hypothetical protein
MTYGKATFRQEDKVFRSNLEKETNAMNIPTVSPLTIPQCSVISIASNEQPVWRSHGQEAKRGETGEQRILWNSEAIGSFLLLCAPPGCP